jgi:hypothetical protein
MKYKVELSIKIMMFSCLLLAGVASATDSVTKTLYIDGAEVATSTVNTALSYPFYRLTIGAEGDRNYCYNGLVGTIDEFAVYGTVLTDANVSAHYNAGNYVTAVQADKPLLYLRFEDATSDDNDIALNSGSATEDGVYIGAVTLTASGHNGKAAVLSGADEGTGDCIDVCDSNGTFSLADVSVEFWVKTTQNTDYPRFFQHNGDTAEQGSYGAMYSAESNAVGLIGGDATAFFNAVLNDDQWHHVVVTFDSLQPASYEAEVLADDPCLYLKFDNELPVDSSVNHYFAGFAPLDNDSSPLIPPSKGKTRPVAGAIGGKAFYCDNSTATAGRDTRAYAWNNYNGTNWREGPSNSVFYDNQYAFAPSDITFELWVKSTPELVSDRWAVVFQQIGGNDGYNGYYEPNGPYLSFPDLDDLSGPNVPAIRIGGGSAMWYPGVNAPLDGDWHQVVVTYDQNEVDPGGSMGIQLYIDGSLANSTTIYDPTNHRAKLGNTGQYLHGESSPTFTNGVLNVLVIGAQNNWGYAYNSYGGYIDEFAIYAGVLSPERVAMHYAAWQPKDCAEVLARGLKYPGDMDGDCDVDLTDYALFAQGWAQCNNPAGCP